MDAPPIIQYNYQAMKLDIGAGGKKEIRGLPKRTGEQSRDIKSILSTHFCRTCGKCCQGFGFSKKDPHFETILKKVKEKKEAFVLKRGLAGHEVGVPRGRGYTRCGFLQRSYEFSSMPAEVSASASFVEDGSPLSCEIYNTQPSTCSMYPLVWSWLADSEGRGIKNGAIVGLDSACCAVGELLAHGIGHLTASEIAAFSQEGGEWKNKAASFPASLRELYRCLENSTPEERDSKIAKNEEGEDVFPLIAPGIVKVVGWNY